MKFPLSWLLEHLDSDASLTHISETLTQLGLEVESIDDKAYLRPLKIARIIEAAPHPNANKLQVLKVDIGEAEPLKIVCGAPNARAGLHSVLAPIGTYLPKLETTIKEGKIRGETSYGMMCSADELGLLSENDGIMELANDAPIGAAFADYAGLCDPIIEISVTPNRADCANIRGIARDLAAFGLGQLKPLASLEPAANEPKSSFKAAPHLCQNFTWCEIWQLESRQSPDWLQRRLSDAGFVPQNCLLDICTYITLDLGIPITILNSDIINSQLQIASLSHAEEFLALDGKKYKLPAGTTVIRSANEIEAAAGLITAAQHKCDTGKLNIILSSAIWPKRVIMHSGRQIGIVNEQRYRFERGIDAAMLAPALLRAQQMIIELCGGTGSNIKQIEQRPIAIAPINFDPNSVKRLTSLDIDKTRMQNILRDLGFTVESSPADENFIITAPSWRHDISQPIDLVEEIVRIYSLNELKPQKLPPLTTSEQKTNATVFAKNLELIQRVKCSLAACGFSEILSWSFISAPLAAAFGGGTEELQLLNPIAANMSDMRPSLLPGLITAAVSGAARGHKDLSLFEISHIYKNAEPNGQILSCAGLRQNQAKFGQIARHWRGNAKAVDMFDAKQDALTLLHMAGINTDRLSFGRNAPSFYHPGRSGLIKLGPQILGHFGELHPDICELMDVKYAMALFELDLDAVAQFGGNKKRTAYVPQTQQNIHRDLAFIVEKTVPAAALQKAAMSANRLISASNVFDVFSGPPIEEGLKSIGLEITISPVEPLTTPEIEAICAKIIANVGKQTGAKLRT